MTDQNRSAEDRRKADFAGILKAAQEVAKVVPPTPLIPIEINGATVFVKAESLQPMGAFKLRGAWHRLVALDAEERKRGVVGFSSGNHAQGVAWAARRLGIKATIVMPSDAPRAKLDATRALGAEIVTHDRATESREAIAAALAAERGATLVPSFDDPWIVEGQGSAGLEAADQMRALGVGPPDAVITPCGGGGLSSGLALALPGARVTIVEPVGWDDMTRSLVKGEIVPVEPNPPVTACDALMTTRVSDLTFGILRDAGATGVAVTESEIENAMRFAFSRLQLVVEPGGACALAAVLAGKVKLGERTLVIVSGGNVDPETYAAILTRQ